MNLEVIIGIATLITQAVIMGWLFKCWSKHARNMKETNDKIYEDEANKRR